MKRAVVLFIEDLKGARAQADLWDARSGWRLARSESKRRLLRSQKSEDFRHSKMADFYTRKMRWLLRLFWNSGDLSISCTKCDLWCKKMSETFVLKIWADFGNKLKVLTAYSAQKEPILGKLSRAVGALQREKTKDFAIFRRYLAYLQRFMIL